MNFRQRAKKLISRITLQVMTVVMMFMPVFGINIAHAEFTCAQILDPEATKGYIVTIIEEQIGTATTADAGGQALNCFRVNTKDSEGKITPTYADSCSPSDTVICQRVQIFFAQSGAELLYEYVGRIYRWAAATIGIVSVFFIVLGGIQISTAQGDTAKIEKAKERIMQSLGGLVILFLSALILYTINPNFFTI
jgi:hypothetical protein